MHRNICALNLCGPTLTAKLSENKTHAKISGSTVYTMYTVCMLRQKLFACSAKLAVLSPGIYMYMLHLTVKTFLSKLIQPEVNLQIATMQAGVQYHVCSDEDFYVVGHLLFSVLVQYMQLTVKAFLK